MSSRCFVFWWSCCCLVANGSLELRPECFLVVGKEDFDSFVRERVLHAVLNDFEGACRDVGAGDRALEHVVRVPDARGENLGLHAVVVVDGADLADEIHAVLADVVESADERADEERACLRDHKRLQALEAQREVGFDSGIAHRFAGFEAVDGAGQLHDDVWRDLDVLAAFLHHAFKVSRDDFRRDWPFAHAADFSETLGVGHAFFGDERWICSDAIEHAEVMGFFHVVEVGGIEIDLHGEE